MTTKPVSPYFDALKDDPKEMTDVQLIAYSNWVESYFKWCNEGHGRKGLYLSLAMKAMPYLNELRRRNMNQTGGNL